MTSQQKIDFKLSFMTKSACVANGVAHAAIETPISIAVNTVETGADVVGILARAAVDSLNRVGEGVKQIGTDVVDAYNNGSSKSEAYFMKHAQDAMDAKKVTINAEPMPA